ncbi:MAG: DNA gyrase inhibitor YacG [Brevundimonas sp.]|nr:DNA gyrase inhibitor YacG [Brevundimonas sp.]
MATCPICRQNEADPKYKPFCSKRCADVDLQRWFTGGYVIPGGNDEPPTPEREED